MGKKRVAKKSKEELLEEKDKVEQALKESAKVRVKKKVDQGIIFINSSYTNTLVSLTDQEGNVLAWSSAGSLGFKGTKKSTSYAASKTAEIIAKKAKKLGVERIEVVVKGLGSGRIAALKSLANFGLDITAIRDETPVPHNGCRPPKKRRV